MITEVGPTHVPLRGLMDLSCHSIPAAVSREFISLNPG